MRVPPPELVITIGEAGPAFLKGPDVDLSEVDRRIILRQLALMILFGPLTILVPRIAAAVISPQRYLDSWQRMARSMLTPDGWFLIVWTALPYLAVGYAGLTFARLTSDPVRARRRRWGLGAALAAVFAVGALINIPTTIAGANLGVAFFPFYAVPFAVAGYAVGYAAARIVGGPVTSSGAPPH